MRLYAPAALAALLLLAPASYAAQQEQQMMRGSQEISFDNVVKSNQIIGKNIKNNKGETIGEVQHLVLDPQTGRVILATISVGGFLGVASTTYAVPWKAFDFKTAEETAAMGGGSPTTQRPPAGGYGGGPASPGARGTAREERLKEITLVLDVDKQKLQGAPKLENDGQLKDQSYIQQVYSHFGQDLKGGSMGSGR